MKLKENKNGTFTLENISVEQLRMLFAVHNINDFSKRLPHGMQVDSDSIFEALKDTPAYAGYEYHKTFNDAVIKYVKDFTA
jgi:hypothetical protein